MLYISFLQFTFVTFFIFFYTKSKAPAVRPAITAAIGTTTLTHLGVYSLGSNFRRIIIKPPYVCSVGILYHQLLLIEFVKIAPQLIFSQIFP